VGAVGDDCLLHPTAKITKLATTKKRTSVLWNRGWENSSSCGSRSQQKLSEAPAIIAGDDFAKLLKEVDEPLRMMVGLIAATGLRIGELLALRWRALDLEVGTLQVRESVYEAKTQQPKTQKARRTIPLGPHAIALLKDLRR
jgi:integrase